MDHVPGGVQGQGPWEGLKARDEKSPQSTTGISNPRRAGLRDSGRRSPALGPGNVVANACVCARFSCAGRCRAGRRRRGRRRARTVDCHAKGVAPGPQQGFAPGPHQGFAPGPHQGLGPWTHYWLPRTNIQAVVQPLAVEPRDAVDPATAHRPQVIIPTPQVISPSPQVIRFRSSHPQVPAMRNPRIHWKKHGKNPPSTPETR